MDKLLLEMGHGDSEKCRDNITSDHKSSRIVGIFIASRKTSTLIGVIFSQLFHGIRRVHMYGVQYFEKTVCYRTGETIY